MDMEIVRLLCLLVHRAIDQVQAVMRSERKDTSSTRYLSRIYPLYVSICQCSRGLLVLLTALLHPQLTAGITSRCHRLRQLLSPYDQNSIPASFAVSSIHPVTNLTAAGSFLGDNRRWMARLSGNHGEQGGHS